MAATNPPDDVEFLPDPAGDRHDDSGDRHDESGRAERPRPRVGAHLLATLLAVIGAALAVVAPFQVAYSLEATGDDGFVFATDGWGRDRSPGEMTDAAQHGPRFGIVFCVAAGLALLGVVLWALARRRRRPTRGGVGSAALLVGAGAILATTVNLFLAALANLESLRFNLRRTVDYGEDGPIRTTTLSLGWLLWLGLAASVLLVAAVVVRTRARTTGDDTDEPGEAEEPGTERTTLYPEPDPSMETLS